MSQAAYPVTTFHFSVDWAGTNIGFTEVSGLDMEVDLVEYRHGASPDSSKTKMPGMKKFSNITLKRGTFAGDNEFYEWWNQNQFSVAQRRDITIQLLNEAGDTVIAWKVKSAFPLKVQTTTLKSDGSEVGIETMEIAHEGLIVQND